MEELFYMLSRKAWAIYISLCESYVPMAKVQENKKGIVQHLGLIFANSGADGSDYL